MGPSKDLKILSFLLCLDSKHHGIVFLQCWFRSDNSDRSTHGTPAAGLPVAAAPGSESSRAKAGDPQGGEIRPQRPKGDRAEPSGVTPRHTPRAGAVRPGAHHVKLSVPGSKMSTPPGLGALRDPVTSVATALQPIPAETREPTHREPHPVPVPSNTVQPAALRRKHRLLPGLHRARVPSPRSLRPARPAQEDGDSGASCPPRS